MHACTHTHRHVIFKIFGLVLQLFVLLLDYVLKTLFKQTSKTMAPHSSTVAWKIPWTEEPGGLQSMGSLRVWHDFLSLFTFMYWRRKWQPTHVLAWRILGMGEPGGLPSMGSHRVGHDWSDLAAAAAAARLYLKSLNRKGLECHLGSGAYTVPLLGIHSWIHPC